MKKIKKIIIILLILLLIGGAAYYFLVLKKNSDSATDTSIKTATVSRQNISSTLSSSGTISPKNSYTITSMVDGTIILADFEEGDQVTEGQVLYKIDSSSMDSKLSSANSSLERGQQDYTDAQNDYNKVAGKLSGNTYKSTEAGYIKKLNVVAGNRIGSNNEIAQLYNDSTMEISVPFLNLEAQQITAGMPATLILSDTLEELAGSVVAVATMDQTLTGGQIVRYVTVSVNNPGGLTSSMTATAEINGFTSSGDATFTPARDLSITASDLTSTVTVTNVLVHEGDYVSAGTPLFTIDAEDVQDILKSYEDKITSAKTNVENAQSTLDSTKDTYDNYTITAPISGTVVTKTGKLGDKVQNGNSASTLAVIYDLSQLTFQMNIDELDISNVKVGQDVAVTADAFDGETFAGKVTTVSMEGTASNGVTYYPVTVTIDDASKLLPGMNVSGLITLDESQNALAIPVDALQRGNLVYVKDSDTSKTTAETGAAAGAEKSAETSAEAGAEKSAETGTEAGAEKSGAEAGAGAENRPSRSTEEGAAGTGESGSERPSRSTEEGAAGTGETGAAPAETGAATGAEKSAAETSAAASGNSGNAKGRNVPDGFHAVSVQTGIISDTYIEIVSGDLSEGDTIYVTQSTVSSSSSEDAGFTFDLSGGGGAPSGAPGGAPSGSGRPSGSGGYH